MGRQRKQFDEEAAYKYYQEVKSLTKTRYRFGVCERSLSKRFHARGWKVNEASNVANYTPDAKPPGAPKLERTRRSKASSRQIDFARDYARQGWKPAVIAAELGLGLSHVNAILGRNDHIGSDHRLLA